MCSCNGVIIGIGRNEKNERAAHAEHSPTLLVQPSAETVQSGFSPENVQSPAEGVRASAEADAQLLGAGPDPADDSPVLAIDTPLR